ncbi:peptidylprolyl isomerase [Ramlibacter sp.]|uniref:peptidylprolyl isomerase n=1 Tax=Ramlibacter sp. TaxID=1917967 RepID=UPI002D4BB087|nr:peptidylprolyl isomerase [Ramlibacter sp.]HYD76963.1 peptidylprolyl isomerase [Ramlibacter sp.]
MSADLTERPVPRPEPQMPSACASGGCGGGSGGGTTATIHVHRRGRPGAEPPAYVAVRVNGTVIAPEAIAEEAQQHPAPDPASAWRAAARALAIRELLLQEAHRLGLAAEPETDEAGRREVDEEALIRAVLETQAAPSSPTREECLRVYEQQRERFRTPPLLEARHILVEPGGDDEAGWDAARHQAATIAREVGDDPAAFAEAAQAFSSCPSKMQGGSLGQLQPGELVPAVQSAIEALPEGMTGREPVRSRFGWHVLRLDRRIPGRQLPFELVESRIADMLEARAWTLAAARFTASLAEAATLEGVALGKDELEAQLW